MQEKKQSLLNALKKETKYIYIKKNGTITRNKIKEKKFGFALVAGIERYPRKVTKKMNQKKILKRTNLKPFVKYVNLNHIMPTRLFIFLFSKKNKKNKKQQTNCPIKAI